MKLTKISMFSGHSHTLDIPTLTNEQYQQYLDSDDLIQNVLPHLTADEREFIMTGVTAEEWDDAFGDEEYED